MTDFIKSCFFSFQKGSQDSFLNMSRKDNNKISNQLLTYNAKMCNCTCALIRMGCDIISMRNVSVDDTL